MATQLKRHGPDDELTSEERRRYTEIRRSIDAVAGSRATGRRTDDIMRELRGTDPLP